MNSSLSEKERIGLEEVFLSISSSQNILQKVSSWNTFLLTQFHAKKIFTGFKFTDSPKTLIKNRLKSTKLSKLLIKIEKRRKN